MLPSKFLAALGAAGLASAATPSAFQPGSATDLLVLYNGNLALNGAVVARDATANEPTLATAQALNGSSYAVLMIDLDIPTNNPPETGTLLHWMQTGLMPSTTASALNTSSGGATTAFALQNTSQTAPFASYLQPNPPAKAPLSHRYTEILVDTTGIQQTALDSLKTAAQTRLGFNAMDVLTSAGLANKVVAGNFYNVTNGGRAAMVATRETESGAGPGTGASSGSLATNAITDTATAGAVGDSRQSMTALALFALATVFLGA